MIVHSGFVDHQMPQKAVDLFHRIEKADEIIYVLLCKACTQLQTQEAFNLAKEVSSRIPEQYHSNIYLITTLIKVLMAGSHVEDAERWFARSRTRTQEMFGLMMKGKCGSCPEHNDVELFFRLCRSSNA